MAKSNSDIPTVTELQCRLLQRLVVQAAPFWVSGNEGSCFNACITLEKKGALRRIDGESHPNTLCGTTNRFFLIAVERVRFEITDVARAIVAKNVLLS